MNEFLLKLYDLKIRSISIDEVSKEQLEEIKLSPYFLILGDNIHLKNEYYLGRIDVKKNFAFLIQDEEDFYIEKRDFNNALDDDIVLVRKNKNDFIVDKVLRRALKSIIATVKIKNKKIRFYTDKDLERFITVIDDTSHLVNGHVVSLFIISIKDNEIITSLNKIVGHINDPGIDILKIVYSYNWPLEFSEEVLDEVAAFNINMEAELKERTDLRDRLIITIDGKDAKDLDDAIDLSYDGTYYHLGVHIADVSYFVREDTLVNEEAYKRATSVYLADRVIPMLPHYLSNNLCSLNPFEDKLTVTCDMKIDDTGKVLDFLIYPSIIESKKRLSYSEVNDLLYNGTSTGNQEIDNTLIKMNELSNILKKIRRKRGAINFKSEELKFIIKNEKVIDIEKRETKDGEELIESFMLAANETVAFHLNSLKYPSIYRIHENPDQDKLDDAITTIKALGIPINYKNLNPKVLQKITDQSLGTRYEYIVHNALLRAMKKAKYANHLGIHYGLQARYYTHFTSPIRRYPDLVIHRLLNELIFKPNDLRKKISHFEEILDPICSHSSTNERKAIDMERDVDKLMTINYLMDKIGNIYQGIITKISGHGMFVKLSNGIEGFISIRDIKGFYEFDERNYSLVNNYGNIYKLGDTIKVEVLSVNPLERLINFKIFKKEKKNEGRRTKQKGKA
ncbi:ribonuclease R [Acholeplasma sp. OttesenSCG-928-E16]|nr:ribonuclease R [Acholeplasma sp. OttesenSCG-928-E16]